jgi:hypothetical protein
VIEGNAFVDNPIHASFGLVNGAPLRAGGVAGRVTDNLFQGGGSINGSSRGWGLELSNVRAGGDTVVARNVFKDAPAGSGYAIALNVTSGNNNYSAGVGINDLVVENNVISNWTTGISVANQLVPGGFGPTGLRDVTIRNNDVQRTQKPTVVYAGNDFSTSHIRMSGNRYNTVAAGFPNALVNTGGPASRWHQWAPGRDFGSAEAAVAYPDAGRSAAAYAGRVGAGSGTAGLVSGARRQTAGTWRPELTGARLAGYVADGFGIGGANPVPVPPPPTPESTPDPDPVPTPQPVPTDARVGADLLNSATEAKIATLTDGYVIDMNDVGTRLTIRANPVGPAGSMVFKLDGAVYRTETYAPFSIGGDDGWDDFRDWTPTAGEHTLEILQYSQAGGGGSVVASTALAFSVVAPAATARRPRGRRRRRPPARSPTW